MLNFGKTFLCKIKINEQVLVYGVLESTNDLGRAYAEQIHLKNLTVASPGSKTRNSVYFNHIYS